MRELSVFECGVVAGGANVSEAATMILNQCRGLPDSAKVTVSFTYRSDIGVGGTGVGADKSVSIETTCGEVKKEAAKVKTNGAVSLLGGSGDFSNIFVAWDSGPGDGGRVFDEQNAEGPAIIA